MAVELKKQPNKQVDMMEYYAQMLPGRYTQ